MTRGLLEPWYDVRSALPKALGNTLLFWADNATGAPYGMDFEEWTDELRGAGEVLLEFYEQDPDNPDDAATERAKDVLHWIADNLTVLWD